MNQDAQSDKFRFIRPSGSTNESLPLIRMWDDTSFVEKQKIVKPKTRTSMAKYGNEDNIFNVPELAGESKGQIFNNSKELRKIKPKNEDADWLDDPEVRAELDAMGGFGLSRSYNLRGEVSNVNERASLWNESKQTSRSTPRKSVPFVSSLKKIQQKKKMDPKQTEKNELLQMMKQRAHTIEDKFKILDARDKLIRLTLQKKMETKVSPTVGICPDMCPEKERLMREIQHQVALYEQNEDKTMSSRLAIKQYSRSSADQEAPLPQELRPVDVLQMTMGYLLHRIMDLCNTSDVNIGEWYHFLWDRTRGIRKDITQQELCSQGSVELVEQCARFHIVCSARLVAEDPSVFDHRINTENLTKCLQTLKYMYHDLELKGEMCINEAEFRAYIILLNLNDGNFMWEVQHLRREIQRSAEVQFALQVYSALDKGNCVKFFKLIRSTTYLNACILMRYFVQVRTLALKTILKSYSPRVSQASLHVHYLTNILAFENNEATTEFFESHGLFTNNDQSRVVLNRSMFSLPEFPYILDRAINLVESKRILSLGEVVCGTKLPQKVFENHIPQDSFNADGYLEFVYDEHDIESGNKKETEMEITEFGYDEQDTSYLRNKKGIEMEITNEEHPLLSLNTTSSYQSEPTSNIFKQIDSDSTDAAVKSDFTPNDFRPQYRLPTVTLPDENILQDNNYTREQTIGCKTRFKDFKPIVPLTPIAPKLDLHHEQMKTYHKQKQVTGEHDRQKTLAEHQLKMRKIENEAIERDRIQAEETRKREEESIKNRLKLREEEELRRVAEMKIVNNEKLRQQLIMTTVEKVIDKLLDTVSENIKEEVLRNITTNIMNRKLRKILQKWREFVRRKRKRKAFDVNPVWCVNMLADEVSKELTIGDFNVTLYNIKRYKRDYIEKTKSYTFKDIEPYVYSVLPKSKPLRLDRGVLKLNLNKLTYTTLTKNYIKLENKMCNELFWKIVISIPDETEFNHGLNHIEDVLQYCINWQIKGNTAVTIEQINLNPTVTYYIERQKGLVVNSHNDANGFIFIGNEFTDEYCNRIFANLRNCSKFVRIPVVCLVQNTSGYEENKEKVNLHVNVMKMLPLEYQFTTRNIIKGVETAFMWLSDKVQKSPPLLLDTLEAFLQRYLCEGLWKKIKSFTKWNAEYKSSLKDPRTLIFLHNDALQRLKKILLDRSYGDYYQFPEVFKEFLRNEIPEALPCDYKYFPSFWRNRSYLSYLEKILDSLNLPRFLGTWPPTNKTELGESFHGYFTTLFELPTKMYYKLLGQYIRTMDPVEFCVDTIWLDLIEAIVYEKLKQTNFTLYGTGFANKSLYNQLVVVYNDEALKAYCKSDWLYIDNPIIKPQILDMLSKSTEAATEVPDINETMNNETDIDIDEIWNNLYSSNYNPKKVTTYKNEISDCKNVLNDLEETVEINKKILETSGNFLKHLLNN